MKLTKWREFEYSSGVTSLALEGGDERILLVHKTSEGIKFEEACDQYFSESYTKEDALKVVDELRQWILCDSGTDNDLLLLQVRELFSKLTDDERIDIMSDYCKHCGCNDTGCQCWNDD